MDHLSHRSPIYSTSMLAEPGFDRDTKETSSRSPTSVFAATEMNNVFRSVDDAIERIDDREKENRPLAPSLICSFASNGELSAFSDDTEEEEGDGDKIPEGNDNGMLRPRLAARQRRSPLSAFRPVSGNKRRCDFTDDHDEQDSTDEYEEYDGAPFKRRRICAPLLCRANPIDSSDDDDTCDSDDLPPMLSSSSSSSLYSFASPFERVCSGDSCSTSNSSYISSDSTSSFASLFAGDDAVTIRETLSVEAAMEAADRSTDTFSIMPR